ncbi:MAG: NAD+ synthase [Limnochordaceae bacterium]|nr:NAD+ synthase [Limnochordaceae bacterium]
MAIERQLGQEASAPLRIALGQIDVTVGDLKANARLIEQVAEQAYRQGAQLVAFPELCLTGYPPEDLLLRPSFIRENRRVLQHLARRLPPLVAIVGFVDSESDIYNAAAVIHGGEVAAVARKNLLPNYGVFDEFRYFESGERPLVVHVGPYRVGVNICEDIWYPDGPMRLQSLLGGAEVIVNISSSPYQMGKIQDRERMLATRALDYRVVLAYVNLVGGQDELVFDGTSCVIDEDGVVVARAPSFQEALLVADVDPQAVFHRRLHDPRRRQQRLRLSQAEAPPPTDEARLPLPAASSPPDRGAVEGPADQAQVRPVIREAVPFLGPEAEVHAALCLGVRDYVTKNGFETVAVAMSGGIDSSLVATLAADALGPERVVGVTMPSRFSSEQSVEDAREVARRLGIRFEVIPIEPVMRAYLDTLRPLFGDRPFDVTEENLQARIRGTLIMALSNKFGWLVLTAGNKSELAVGYLTLYGADTTGGFAVIKDVPKTWVYRLARWRNTWRGGPVIPDSVLTKAPSAELRPGQKDTDTLPPYEVLDPMMAAYVEEDRDAPGLVAMGFDAATVERVAAMIARSEYKRRQAPPGVKVTRRAFGRDWRFPITNRYVERLARPSSGD